MYSSVWLPKVLHTCRSHSRPLENAGWEASPCLHFESMNNLSGGYWRHLMAQSNHYKQRATNSSSEQWKHQFINGTVPAIWHSYVLFWGCYCADINDPIIPSSESFRQLNISKFFTIQLVLQVLPRVLEGFWFWFFSSFVWLKLQFHTTPPLGTRVFFVPLWTRAPLEKGLVVDDDKVLEEGEEANYITVKTATPRH